MHAVQFKEHGAPEVLQTVELDLPEPRDHDVLIRVYAAGVNFAETQMRAGTYPMPLALPAVLGSEVLVTFTLAGDLS